MEIEAGKSYHIKTPDTNGVVKVHVDYLLENQVNNRPDAKLVVYRVWIASKKYWRYYVNPYYVLCIFNDWKYEK